jgi:hypothetical protein
MERGNRLGIVALIVSVIALVVAISGRFDQPRVVVQTPGNVPQAAAPGQRFEQRDDRELRGFAPGMGERGGRFEGGYGHGPRHGGFFGPFFWLSQLLKLAAAIALILLGLRLLRGPRGPWGGWRGRRGPWGGPPSSGPPNDPPPATPMSGETIRL